MTGEKIELVCVKGNNVKRSIVSRGEVTEKRLKAREAGWTCTPYQIGFYQEFDNKTKCRR